MFRPSIRHLWKVPEKSLGPSIAVIERIIMAEALDVHDLLTLLVMLDITLFHRKCN